MTIELTDAENEMIEILRADNHITLTVTRDGERWHVRLEDHDSGIVGDGHGATFDRAWDDVANARLRDSPRSP